MSSANESLPLIVRERRPDNGLADARTSSAWVWIGILAAVSFAAGYSCACNRMQLTGSGGALAASSGMANDLSTALDRGIEMAANVERRTGPLSSKCYPKVNGTEIVRKGRSLTMIRTRIVGIRQFSLFIHPLLTDQFASQELIMSGENHPSTTAVLCLLMPRLFGARPSFYDIGANIGYFTHLTARLGARVVAIEPTAYHRRLLRLSLTINQLQRAVIVVPHALTASAMAGSQTACMDMDPTNAGNTQASIGVACRPEMLAKLTTLGHVIEEHGSPQLMKVDVEGFEILALKGGEAHLAKAPPSVVIFEYNSATWPVAPTARAWIDAHPEALSFTGGLEARNHQMAAELVAFFCDGPVGRARYVMYDLNAPASLGAARGRADWLAYLSGGAQAKIEWNTDLLLVAAEVAAKHELDSLGAVFALGEEPDGSMALGQRRFITRARLSSPRRRFEAYLHLDAWGHGKVCVQSTAQTAQTAQRRPKAFLINQEDGNLCMRHGMAPQALTDPVPLWCHSTCVSSAGKCALRVTDQGELRWGIHGAGGEVLASIRGSRGRPIGTACFP